MEEFGQDDEIVQPGTDNEMQFGSDDEAVQPETPEEESWWDYTKRAAVDAVEKSVPLYGAARQTVGAFTGDPTDLDEAAADAAIGAVYEGPRRLIETAGNVIGEGFDSLTGLDTVNEENSTFLTPFEGISGEGGLALETGATLGPTLAGGVGGAALIGKILTTAPKAAAYIGNAIGGAVGYASSKKPGEDRLLVGPDRYIPGLSEVDEEGNRNALNTYINDVTDAMLIAFPADAAAQGAAKLGKLVWNTVGKGIYKVAFGSAGAALEDNVARQFLEHARIAGEIADPVERTAAIHKLADEMVKNQEVLFKVGPDDLKLQQDTVSALEEALKGIEGADAEIIRQKARSLRSGALQAGGRGETASKVSGPSMETESRLRTADVTYGGDEGINVAKAGVQKQAQDRAFTEGTAPVVAKEVELETAEKNLDNIFKTDPALKDQIGQLSDTVKLNIFEKPDATVDEMRSAVEQGYKTMDKEMSRLVEEIPDNEVIDMSDVIEELGALDKRLLREEFGLHMPEEGGEEVLGNFKTMWKKLVPELNLKIDALRRNAQDDSAWRRVRDAITDKVDTIPGAEEFNNYYKQVWAPIWKDGKLDDFRKLHKSTIGRGEDIGKVDYEAGSGKLLRNSMEDDPAFTEHLNKLMKMPESGAREGMITDWYLQNAAANIQSELNLGKKLTEVDLKNIITPLQKRGANIQRIDPEGTKRIEAFLTKVRDQKGDAAGLQKELEFLVKQKEKVEKQIFEQDYAEFFEKNKISVGEGFRDFDALLKNDKNSNKVIDILNLATKEGNEDIRKGMKAAYVRHLKDEIFSKSAKMEGGARKMDVPKISDYESGKTNLRSYGKKIFEDEPETLEFFESLIKHGKQLEDATAGVKQIPQYDHIKGMILEASSAADRLITLTFGVLNRLAARARSIKGMALQDYDKNLREGDLGNIMNLIVDRFYSDPKYAAELIKRVSVAGSKPSKYAQALREWILFQLPNNKPEEIDKAIEEVQNSDTAGQTEEAFEK